MVAELGRCTSCRVEATLEDSVLADPKLRVLRGAYEERAAEILSSAVRPGTTVVSARGLQLLRDFGEKIKKEPILPCEVVTLQHFAIYLLDERGLDISTVRLAMTAVSKWHLQTKNATGLPLPNPTTDKDLHTLLTSMEKTCKKDSKAKLPFTPSEWWKVLHYGFDLTTVGGRHNELFFMLLSAGPLRPGVTAHLMVDYKVSVRRGRQVVEFVQGSDVKVTTGEDGKQMINLYIPKDKNVNAKNKRWICIPTSFMGVNPVRMMLDYLMEVRPPPGLLLAAVKAPLRKMAAVPVLRQDEYRDPEFFHSNPYTAQCALVRRGFMRAFPKADEEYVKRAFGGGTPRKTFGECVSVVGHSLDTLRSLGGWVPRDKDVVREVYVHLLDPARNRLLRKLMQDLVDNDELRFDLGDEPSYTRKAGQTLGVTSIVFISDAEEQTRGMH